MDADGVARLRAAVIRLERRLNAPAREDVGLTPTQIMVLATVVRHRRIGIGELAACEGLNPTMLSRAIGRLDDAGLIRRVPDPHDGRAALIEPTAAGRRMKQRINDKRTAVLAEHLAALSAEHESLLQAALPALEALAAERSRQ